MREAMNSAICEFEKNWIREACQMIMFVTNTNFTPALEEYLVEAGIVDVQQDSIGFVMAETVPVHSWDYNGLRSNVNFFGTQRDWNETILNRMGATFMAQIGQRKKRMFKYVVTTPSVSVLLMDLSGAFRSRTSDSYDKETGCEHFGMIHDIHVFVSYSGNYVRENTILLGLTDENIIEDQIHTWPEFEAIEVIEIKNMI